MFNLFRRKAASEFAPGRLNRTVKLKKDELVRLAEKMAEGTNWLPAVFRAAKGAAPSKRKRSIT